jgi:predicted RNase H-like HicB family nuclease
LGKALREIKIRQGSTSTDADKEDVYMKSEFTAVFEKRGKWYIGFVEEVPGVNSQGRTLKEARKNLKEALSLILEANRELTEKRLSGQNVVREPIAVNS